MRYIIVLTCLLLFTFPGLALAQYSQFYDYPLQESEIQDASFEYEFSELPNPERVYAAGEIATLTRSWIGTADEERTLGRKLKRLNGQGGVAVWFGLDVGFLPPAHFVTVRAKTEGTNSSAFFGVNYFDADWRLIEQKKMPIVGSDVGVSRGEGDLIKRYTLPVYRPSNAVFAQIWIHNAGEGTLTFDFLTAFIERPFGLIRNATLGSEAGDYATTEFWQVLPGSESGVGYETRQTDVGYQIRELALLGQRSKITTLYQVTFPEAGKPYEIRLFGKAREISSAPQARGWVGIDFFDTSNRKIGDRVIDLSNISEFDLNRGVFSNFTTPVACDYAIVWFYIEPLFRNEQFRISGIDVFPSVFSASTVSIRPANAPRSPITASLARNAQDSILAVASDAGPAVTVSAPVKKPTPKKPTSKKPTVSNPKTK